jgi:hypothetical protein
MDTVTGDAPQPGETPRTEGNPWSFDPDAAWWRGEGDREHAEALAEAAARPRHPRRRPAPGTPGSAGTDGDDPVFAGEAPDAHAAGVQDTVLAITETPAEQAGTLGEPVAETSVEIPVETPEPVERDHDESTGDRYNPPEAPPEPGRNQPTVALDRGTLPDQPSGLTRRAARPGQTRMSAAELNLKQSRMENSPFWLNDEQHATATNAWPEPETHRRQPDDADPVDERRGRAPRHRPRSPRAAGSGLFALIALGLIAAFFSWVSAEPFWLATGHGARGVATVTRCTGTGVTQRCVGSFAAAGGDFSAGTVSLLGVPKTDNDPGTVAPARMVNPTSKQAYVGSTGTLLQLRWVLGFLLVLLCGLGIAGLTGTRRLESIRARRTALLMSLAGPLLLLAGFLFATY